MAEVGGSEKGGGKGVRKVGNVLRCRGSGRATGNERRLGAYWFESVWTEKNSGESGECEGE